MAAGAPLRAVHTFAVRGSYLSGVDARGMAWSLNGGGSVDLVAPALEIRDFVRRVIELADEPLDFVVATDGTLLVAVDAALLRVRP